jgi:glycosyltransferase involved in cell wall biosynthesis
MIRTVQKLSQKYVNFQFKIISDGELKPHIEFAKELGIFKTFVQFESTKSTLEIAEEISKSNALVLFSNYENFPCVIAEAMMLGVPIISTNVNGIPEHVSSMNGILIPKQDEEALLEALLQFVEKKTTFSHTEIQKYALSQFSYAAVGRKLNEVYHEVIRNHAS